MGNIVERRGCDVSTLVRAEGKRSQTFPYNLSKVRLILLLIAVTGEEKAIAGVEGRG